NTLNSQPTFTIGGNTPDGRYFIGLMDEVRIWSVARSQAEIAATMFERLAGNEPGLVAYYRFDEPGAAQAVDSSPSPFDAQLFGVDWAPSDAPVCGAPADAAPPPDASPVPDASAMPEAAAGADADVDAPGADE